MISTTIRFFAMAVVILVAIAPRGQARESDSVESILDQLERRLNDFESESMGLNFPNDSFTDIDEKPAQNKLPKTQSEIRGSIKEVDNLTEITDSIAKLEGDIAKLEADVQRTKQKVLEQSQINNFVEIMTVLKDTEKAGIKSFTAKIDGYEIYGINDSISYWLPNAQLPIYAGPLQPGSHRLDIEARVVMKYREKMPLDSDVYQFINKSFDMKIPDQNFKKRWTIEIEPAGAGGTAAELKLSIKDI